MLQQIIIKTHYGCWAPQKLINCQTDVFIVMIVPITSIYKFCIYVVVLFSFMRAYDGNHCKRGWTIGGRSFLLFGQRPVTDNDNDNDLRARGTNQTSVI